MGMVCSRTCCEGAEVTPEKIVNSEDDQFRHGVSITEKQENDYVSHLSIVPSEGIETFAVDQNAAIKESDKGELTPSSGAYEHISDLCVDGNQKEVKMPVAVRDDVMDQNAIPTIPISSDVASCVKDDDVQSEMAIGADFNTSNENTTLETISGMKYGAKEQLPNSGSNFRCGCLGNMNHSSVDSPDVTTGDNYGDAGITSDAMGTLIDDHHHQDFVGEAVAVVVADEDTGSAGGTAGSEEGSFVDRVEPVYDRFIAHSSENRDLRLPYDVVDEDFFGNADASRNRTASLTPFSLEKLNCLEIDRTERVRSFIQAWQPLQNEHVESMSNSLEGTLRDSGEMLLQPENQRSCKLSDLCEDENSQDDDMFNSTPEQNFEVQSNFWGFKDDRAPWIEGDSHAGNSMCTRHRAGALPRIRSDDNEGADDDADAGWSNREKVAWRSSSNRLTVCSMSTINEESDNDEFRDTNVWK